MSATYTYRDSAGLDRVVASLRNWSLLGQLSSADFRKVTDLIRSKAYKAGTQVTPYRGRDTNLYILRSGRLLIRRPSDKYIDARQRVVVQGDIVNDISWLTGQSNDLIIEALDDVVVWFIEREKWVQLLADNPEIERTLNYPDEIRKYLDEARQYKWLQPGERKVLLIKKHWWVFVSKMWWSIPLGAGALAMVAFNQQLLEADALVRGLAVALGTASVLNLIWQFVDWRNDFYALTDRRVIHYERVLLFSQMQDEAPLDRIQEVTVQQLSLPSTVLGIGDVIISQIGTDSRVTFANIANPAEIGKAISRQQQLGIRYGQRATEREDIRDDVRAAIELKERPSDLPPPLKVNVEAYQGWRARYLDRLQEYREFRNTILPYSRLVEGDNIIYRKHWLELVKALWLPLWLTSIFLAGIALIFIRVPDIGTTLRNSPLVLLIPFLIGTALLIWLYYDYENWRNDIFVLTKNSLIDIDRLPLGLSTQRVETKMDKVQTVSSKTRGVLDTFFNVGDVVIKTGGTSDLVFQRVADPQGVQADISKRLEEFKRNAVKTEAQKRRSEFREWFNIYHEETRLHTDNNAKIE